ncbi:DUF4870 family protein [Neisseria dentiae]|uniref:DUF4870 family protein n=1 Tax=Neisseria dentiae TaxID=194197 RepID=UPI0035A1C2F8
MSNDVIEHNSPAPNDSLRTYSIIIYALYALSLVNGITALVGVIMAYVKRDEMADTVYQSHAQYLIKTFWYTLLGMFIGWLTLFIFIGFAVILAASVWFIYRVVVGFMKLLDNQPVSPDGWL